MGIRVHARQERWWHEENQTKNRKNVLVGRGRSGIILASILIFLIGAGIYLYPRIQEFFFEHHVESLKEEFLHDKKDVQETFRDDADSIETPMDRLYEYMKSENEKLFLEGQYELKDAFSYEQPAVDLSEYGIEDNCVGFISLPSIDMELPIYLGANKENMKKGAVHLTQTSYPIGGENTNCVIAAHRGTSLVMFRNIHKIQIGDEITITNFRETLHYRAAEIKIIKPTDVAEIKIQPGRDLITLISCNPLGANYQRYALYCERVPN